MEKISSLSTWHRLVSSRPLVNTLFLKTLLCCRKVKQKRRATDTGIANQNMSIYEEEAPVVKFTVHTLGEHVIDNMIVSGPFQDIIMAMAEMFLATYSGPPDGDLDYAFVEYIIGVSMGQGRILDWQPSPPQKIQ
jgi:hypothetical protein